MPQDETDLNQVVIQVREKLEYKVSDEDLIFAINRAIEESKDLKEKIDEVGKFNKAYWKNGTIKDLSRFHPKKSKVVSNRIFTDVETAIPILTSEPPEPEIVGEVDNNAREVLSQGLKIAYEIKYKMQQKLQCLIRHWFLFRLGVLKYRWNKEKGFITENVLTRKIGFDKRAVSKETCEYVWEEMEDTAENLIAKFPKKKTDITSLVGGKERLKSKIKYLEFWGGGGEWVCWKYQNTILDKKKNPNYDYENEENNLFSVPQFPYIFLNVFNFGDETGLYDETSLIEQASSMQEGANQLEQQIINLNEGQMRVWVTMNVLEKDVQDLIDKTGDLAVKTRQPNAVNQVQSGKPDASLFNNLTHLLGEIDNIIGMHSTTRGERAQQETLGGRQLLKSSDYGRLDLIVRNVEQVMEEWYLAYLHMIKVYSLQPEILSKGMTTVELKSEEIPNNLLVLIKKGSTLPTDRPTKMQNAILLTKAGMIDPETLFEEMGYSAPKERAQKLLQWLAMTGKVQMPSQQVQGGGEQQTANPQGQQVQKLQNILQSGSFQKLPDKEKLNFIQQAKQIVQTIKGGV